MNKQKWYPIVYYAVFVILMIGVLMNKKNFHVDEIYSYGLSNHIGGPALSFEQGKKYQPASIPYDNYVTVAENERFQYKNVWENQRKDNHPPLFYAILHTICSFFPGTFSIWYAGVINIVFACITLYFVRKLLCFFIEDGKIRAVLTVVFIASPGILSAVSFLRMYIMAMAWVTILTWLLVVKEKEDKKVSFWVKVFLTVLAGALTHYYCIVYTVFISVVYGVCLLIRRDWKNFGKLCLTMLLAAGCSIAIFPAMLKHIFKSARGTEAMNNFSSHVSGVFSDRIKEFVRIINGQLFGNLLRWILLLMILLLIVIVVKSIKKEEEKHWRLSLDDVQKYIVAFLPMVCYFLMIGKIAAYLSDRYMFPVYALLQMSIMGTLTVLLVKIMPKRTGIACAGVLLWVMTANIWKIGEWKYLYLSSVPLLEQEKAYEDVDCLYIYDAEWKTQASFMEVPGYHSVTFIKNDDLQLLKDTACAEKDRLIVVVIGDREQILGQIQDICPQLTEIETIGEYSYGKTSYLHGN